MRGALCILIGLVLTSGCVGPFQRGKSITEITLPKVPPAPVTPDQVTAKNAHDQAAALKDEMAYEDMHEGKQVR